MTDLNDGVMVTTAALPIDRFYESVARHADAIAVSDARGDLTYRELRARVDALACAMQAMDAAPGSRVGICARNTAAHLTALLATYAAGKVWVPLSPRNGVTELDAMIAATQPTLLVTDAASVDRFTPTAAPVVMLDGDTRSIEHVIAPFLGQSPTRVARGPEDEQIIKFSGGSTGAPKPVVQSVRTLHAQADGLREFFALQHDDVNLIVAPLTHGASCFVLPVLERGGRHVLLAESKPALVFDAMVRYGVTTMYAPPTLLYALMDAGAPDPRALASLRHVIYSAAPMTPERIRECQRFFGPVIETAYGQVEAPQIITGMRAPELLVDANLTSVGRASGVATIGIMGANGELLGAGEEGEIVVRGPLLMSGYLHREEETARTLVGGWLHTGDVGVIDARGYLFIRARLREIINTGGFKVFPGDVEASLARHAAVSECAVFGVADAKWGEAVCAAVVLAPNATATAAELQAHVKAELGSVKSPKRIWFVAALSRNAAGKVSRAGVRDAVLSQTVPPGVPQF